MIRRLAIAAALVLTATACTPAEAVWITFGHNGSPELHRQAVRVAGCESGNGGDFTTVNPGAVSPTNDHGLFQINAVHRRRFEAVTGQPWSAVYDPFWNAVYARWLYDQRGWRPWTCRRAL